MIHRMIKTMILTADQGYQEDKLSLRLNKIFCMEVEKAPLAQDEEERLPGSYYTQSKIHTVILTSWISRRQSVNPLKHH